jgi:Mlc titration factor MtfA (ptsG expression regulator)
MSKGWQWLESRRRARILARRPLDDGDWQAVLDALPMLSRLTADERDRLRTLATLFARQKTFIGTHGLAVTDYMRVAVAAQACLPILELGLDCYRDWRTIVLYPGAFVAPREHEDDAGVVHSGYEELDGESMAGGPMALSWEEVDPEREPGGPSVVLHECAHKLDELDGNANGMPPLHADMVQKRWTEAFSAAYERFTREVDAFEAAPDSADEPSIDDYAATDPAEFFAVMTEAFFETPSQVAAEFPEVYEQLARFYRQDPAARAEVGSRPRAAPTR